MTSIVFETQYHYIPGMEFDDLIAFSELPIPADILYPWTGSLEPYTRKNVLPPLEHSRRYHCFTQRQTKVLCERFKSAQYIQGAEARSLAAQIGIDCKRVKTWFANKRRLERIKKLRNFLRSRQ